MSEVYRLKEITVAEAHKILSDYGSRIGIQQLYAGIRQGVFPFGLYIEGNGNRDMYTVYAAPLMRWINERTEAVTVPEWITELDRQAAERKEKTTEWAG